MSEQRPATPTIQPEAPPALEQDWRGKLDPTVLALASNPDSVTDPALKARALTEASRLSGGDRVILTDDSGQPRWGQELSRPGQVFAFRGGIRGRFDQAPDDWDEVKAQGLDRFPPNTLRGEMTHLIIETEDGQQLMIRRTNKDTNVADNQEFDIASTTKAGTDDERRPISSSMLKDVVAIVGEPLVLGIDPSTGKRVMTRGAITKVTAFDIKKDPVDPRHPRLASPENHRDAIDGFGEAMKAARAHKLGEMVAAQTVEIVPNNEVAAAQQEEAAPSPYERLTDEQLTLVRENIADSVIQGIRRYDHSEVARSGANLAAIQREFQARFPELQPKHARGEEDGHVTYITEPDSNVIHDMVQKLQSIDGGPAIAAAMYGGYDIPPKSQADQETRLQAIEVMTLLSGISKEARRITGSEFQRTENPYAANTNEQLVATVDRMKQTILSLRAKGRQTEADSYAQKLAQVGQVIKSRQQ